MFRHGVWLTEKEKEKDRSDPQRLQTGIQRHAAGTKTVSSDCIAKITNGIVSWITKDCRPISIVNDEGFVNIMKIATGCNTYSAPCYSTITEKMHHIYSEECKTLSSKLQAAPAVSLTADFWTSAQNKAYLGITVHFIEE